MVGAVELLQHLQSIAALRVTGLNDKEIEERVTGLVKTGV